MVFTSDLKEAYRSGKFSSSKVKRSGGSMVVFNEATAGPATDEGTTETAGCGGPDTVHTDTGAELGAQEKVETHMGPGLEGKASEKEAAPGEAVDMLAAHGGVAEAAGMVKTGPGGTGEGNELMEVMVAAGGSPGDGETDGWGTGRLDPGLGM